jgi:tripartite-type tricarboxylate transporter receptor subunit TctC
MPKPLVERWHREIVKALANPEAVAQLHKTGVEPQSSSPAEFGKYIESEYQTWGKVVKEARIKAQ